MDDVNSYAEVSGPGLSVIGSGRSISLGIQAGKMGDVNAFSMSMPECGSVEEIRAMDSNLASLCQHIQVDGWNGGTFSDIVIESMGATFKLHRLILSRSSYFRHMLQGPWKEAGAPVVTLQIDDENVDREAVTIALAYFYGHHPKLNDSNAFRVLAAASFLDLQDLCAICTDFIISEIWSSNFLVYQAFAESQDYGIHGDRVRKACWGYLCRGGAVELREILPKLSTQTLCALLTSDELWVPSEEKRFELALGVLLAKGCLQEINSPPLSNTTLKSVDFTSGGVKATERLDANVKLEHKPESRADSRQICSYKNFENHRMACEVLVELADSVVDCHSPSAGEEQSTYEIQGTFSCPNAGIAYVYRNENMGSPNKSQIEVDIHKPLSKMQKAVEASRTGDCNASFEESPCSGNHKLLFRDELHQCSSPKATSTNRTYPSGWGRYNSPTPSWGGRVVGRKQIKAYPKESNCNSSEELDALLSIFEGGGILYCHMTFEGLLDVRKRLEELGFSCKSVYDGLWLQMLLRHQVQVVAADTCNNCCHARQSCRCRQSFDVFSHGRTNDSFYRDDRQRIIGAGTVGSLYGGDTSGGANVSSVPARVRVRAAVDGLAGIGRGSTFVPPDVAWPPTRVVFSRVPYGLGSRNTQHNLANEQSEGRVDLGELDLSREGLTAAVGLSQGTGNGVPVHSDQTLRIDDQRSHCRVVRDTAGATSSSNIAMQRVDPDEHPLGQEWETAQDTPISMDLQTPLRDFPPFRFGVEFEDVHRLVDGQAKHSPEVFYAGSLWKVSVQAFNDEDPQGRRTLGLFLHRRKAENMDALQKVHLYLDTREKVTVRYQLICPSKREVMVFGSLTQSGTLLPKAPKGWGWRTALLFDELSDLVQGGSLRVAAVIQLV